MNWFDRFLDVLIKVVYATAILSATILFIVEIAALFIMIGGKTL